MDTPLVFSLPGCRAQQPQIHDRSWFYQANHAGQVDVHVRPFW